jgi:O-antigen ligase
MNAMSLNRSDLGWWHGVSLLLFAAGIPLGEGVALGGLAFVTLFLVLRWRSVDWRALTRGTMRTVLIGWAVWLVAGLAMAVVGSAGWLKPTELGVHSPLLAAPVVFLAVSSLDATWPRRIATTFLVVLLLASLFGIAQYSMNLHLDESVTGFGSTLARQGTVPGESGRAAASGFFLHRLKMAHVLLVGAGVLLARQLHGSLSRTRRILELASLGLVGVTLLLTFTRAALLGAALGVIACALSASRRVRLVTLLGAAVVALTVAVVPVFRERALSIAGRQASSVRGLIWSQGVAVLADHPLGAGIGNYPRIVPRYYDVARPEFNVRTYPHSIALAVWAETGPVGLVAFAWAWFAFLLACLRRLRRGGPAIELQAAAAGLFCSLAFWVVGMTHDVLFHKPVALAFAGMIGLVLAVADKTGSERLGWLATGR